MVAISSYISNLTRHSAAMDVLGKRMGSGRVAATLPATASCRACGWTMALPPTLRIAAKREAGVRKPSRAVALCNLSALRLSPKTSDPNFCSTYCKHW